MSQPCASKPLPPPPPPPETTDNPIAALGRKVKSALGSSQQPSIRIYRESNSNGRTQNQDFATRPEPIPEKPDTYANRFKSLFMRKESSPQYRRSNNDSEDDTETIDLLDVMDPEVATLSTLTNVQNSLFVPQLGKLVNRRPTYRISESAKDARMVNKLKTLLKNITTSAKDKLAPPSNFEFAVLPDDEKLEGWSNDDKEELDDMVRHQLHSKRAKFRRSMKGFKQYVRRPFGLFITVYATLITLFGAAWVFFLIGWISLGSRQSYVINVVDNVLVALFAIIGDGLAPFRAVDTYHMLHIAYYHRLTWRKRSNLGLPKLQDRNDLPEVHAQPAHLDLESQVARKMPATWAKRISPYIPARYASRILSRAKASDPSAYEYSVLTPEQQAKLDYHARKFAKSHTFYKPHETETHYAFPLKLLVAVVLLLDLHSCLQITLGACTWGIDYKTRPFALTTVILCFSITCNILGGVLISQGDKRTRKHEVVERLMRQELTAEAIVEIRERKVKRGDLSEQEKRRIEMEKREKEEKENEEIKRSWKSVAVLPKTLLGKGVDHRQPSLPREMRGSSAGIDASKSSVNIDKKSRSKTAVELGPLSEEPRKPGQVRRKEVGSGVRGGQSSTAGPQEPEQSKGQKVLGFFRKADFDRS